MKKVFLAMFAVCAVSTLSGCVVSPGSYDNVELIQCAQRGKVIFRRDSFGLCGEELAARLNKGTITQNDMIAGGMGTQAAISRESALIQATEMLRLALRSKTACKLNPSAYIAIK